MPNKKQRPKTKTITRFCCVASDNRMHCCCYFLVSNSPRGKEDRQNRAKREKLTVLGYVNLQSSADSVIKATKLTITVEIKAHYYAVNNNNCNLNAKDSDGSCSVSVRHTHSVCVHHLHTDIFFSICVCS